MIQKLLALRCSVCGEYLVEDERGCMAIANKKEELYEIAQEHFWFVNRRIQLCPDCIIDEKYRKRRKRNE